LYGDLTSTIIYNLLPVLFHKSFFLVLTLVSTQCFSQEDVKANIRDVTKLNFFNPGFSYEKRIVKLQSLTAQAFLSTSIYFGYSSSLGNTSGIDVYPALSLQYRYYYNVARRNAKGKRTEMNSANYINAITEIDLYKVHVPSNTLEEIRTSKLLGIGWGFQRNYTNRFSVDLSFGLGYVFTKQTTIDDAGQVGTINTGEFTNVVQIGLGFWVNKRN